MTAASTLAAVVTAFGAHGAIFQDLANRRLHHQATEAVANHDQFGLATDGLPTGDQALATCGGY